MVLCHMLLALLLSACASNEPTPDPVTTCAGGEVLDGETCVPEACGAGTWGNLPVDGNTVYVNVEAVESGDGSGSAPLTSIQAGVDLAGERGGGLVALAAGTYVEVVAMGSGHDGVTLAGRCRELVTMDGSEGDDQPAIEIIGERKTPEIGIEGVTVTGGTYSGMWVQAAMVSVSASDVRQNAVAGIIAAEAEVTLDDVGAYDSQPSLGGDWGRGIDVEPGAALTATRCIVQGNTEVGVFASGAGTLVELVDTRILDTSPSPDGSGGHGVEVNGGAALTATGCTVQGNTELGVLASDAGTAVDLVDTAILDTSPSPDGNGGRGIGVQAGAALTATGCTVQGNTDVGVLAWDAGTVVDLVDTEVLDTFPRPDGNSGRGVGVQAGAALTATGCTVQGNSEIGVFASGADTVVELADTRILDTSPGSDGRGGQGVEVEDGAALTATRCTVQGNTELGVLASDPGTVVELVETEILDTSASPDGAGGRGLGVQDGAALTARGCTVKGNTDIGVFASGAGTVVELVDTGILDTAATPGGTGGHGVEANDGAALTATACTVEGNTALGVLASDGGTVVELVNTSVLHTASSPDGSGGRGVEVSDGAALAASGCTVQGNAEIGVLVVSAGTVVELVDTRILDTAPNQDGKGGHGVEVDDGATLTATGCTVQGNTELGVFASGAGTVVELVDTGILDTSPSPDGDGGRGVVVQEGAALTATGCAVGGNTDVGVYAASAGTVVRFVDTRILDTRRGRISGLALGAMAQDGAMVMGTDSEISGTEGPGLYVVSGGWAELDGVPLTGNTFAGAVVLDGSATLTASAITDTHPDAEWGGGIGVYASDRFGSGTLTVTDSTIGPHDYAAIWLDGSGTYDIEGNTVSGSGGVVSESHTLHGNALFAENGATAWDGATGLLLTDNTFSAASGIGVLLDDSSAMLVDNTWSGNGTDLRQQLCDGPDHVHGPVVGEDGTVSMDDAVPLTADDLLGIPVAIVCPASNVLTAYDLEFTTLYLPAIEVEE